MPWYRSPPAWNGGGTKVEPSVCIFTSGVRCPVSPKSKAYRPFVRLGHAAGSTAITRIDASSRSARPMNGNASPEKFEPPPVQPMTTSG